MQPAENVRPIMAMREQLEPVAQQMDTEVWIKRVPPLREIMFRNLGLNLNEAVFNSLRERRLQVANTTGRLLSIPMTCISFIEEQYGGFLDQLALEQLGKDPEYFIFLNDILRGMQFTLAQVHLAEKYLAEGADQPTMETIRNAEENFFANQPIPIEDATDFYLESQKNASKTVTLLKNDPTGINLLDEFVESLKQEAQVTGSSDNTFLANYLKKHVPSFFIGGAELARDLYKRFYPPLYQALSTQ